MDGAQEGQPAIEAPPGDEPPALTLQEFLQRYPCDARAQDYLSASSSVVVERVLREFRPPREGEGDYSALLVTFVRSLRHQDLASRLGTAAEDGNPNGHAAAAGRNIAELQAEIERFKLQFPLDEAAHNYLVNSPPEVQWVVLQDFNPPRQGESDYSALLISFTKRCRQGMVQQQQQQQLQQQHLLQQQPFHHAAAYAPPGPNGLPPSGHFGGHGAPTQSHLQHGVGGGGAAVVLPPGAAPGGAAAMNDEELAAEVQEFVKRYPVDEMAYNYLTLSPPEVQAQVIREFRPPREGEADYSALVISFSKRCRSAAGAFASRGIQFSPAIHGNGVIGTPEYEAFKQRYPIDEMAHNYLANSTPEVQYEVLRTFKPQKEGDADYSALLITYTKRCRQTVSQRAASEAARAHQYHQLGGAFPGAGVYRGPPSALYGRPPAPTYPTYQRPPPPQYPQYQQHPRGPPQHQGGRPWAPPAAPQQAWSPPAGGGGGCWGQPGGGAGASAVDAAELEAFRQRFPMDDRAFSYLADSPMEVQRQVMDTFVPKRLEDTDFSAPVVAYAKLCRARSGAGYTVPPHYAPQGGAGYAAPGQQYGAPLAQFEGSLTAMVGDFCRRYPVDSRALEMLLASPPAVTSRVLREFKPKREGEGDYSAAVVAFMGVVKRGLHGDYGPGPPKRPRMF